MGPEDERGALNWLTPERVVAAARLIRTGRVFSLGLPLHRGQPREKLLDVVPEVVRVRGWKQVLAPGEVQLDDLHDRPREPDLIDVGLAAEESSDGGVDGVELGLAAPPMSQIRDVAR